MPLKIYRLRRLLAVIAVMFCLVVAGMYVYARLRQRSVLKGLPGKIGIEIKQTASGFQFSKSESGRTVFTLRAKDVKEFKLNGHADLRDVSITLYGRDTSRFDQIYGDDFSFDPKSGDVTARGEVQIDLQANPSGDAAPDQAIPKELKDPIHLKTRDLIFNRNSGDAATDARVDFRTPQATGWAVGVRYSAKSATLTLASQIHVTLTGQEAATLLATHGVITRAPREIVLDHPVMKRESGTLESEKATFLLGPDNEVQRILATGNVNAETSAETANPMRARADEAELSLEGKQNLLRTAVLTGKVHVERTGPQSMQGDAGRAVLDFRGQNELEKVHAAEGVHLTQRAAAGGRTVSADGSMPQDFDLTAPAVDFFVVEGRRLDRAETIGAAQITISPAENQNSASEQRTVITASRFDAKFALTPEGRSRLDTFHGAPNAKIVNSAASMPDRVSTSQTLDATFLPGGGIESIVQQGTVAYSDGMPPEKRTQAWADKAVYTPAERILVLTGKPRVNDGGMTTTATTIRINRANDEAIADGNVKTTYSDLKEQPDGALLASSSPIHVTAARMTAHSATAVALYQGNTRLWQDANIIEAPAIQFDRDHRSLVAQGTRLQSVSTVLVQAVKGPSEVSRSAVPGQQKQNLSALSPREQKKSEGGAEIKSKTPPEPSRVDPVTVTSGRLTYSDADRRAHYEGGVKAVGTGFTASADEMDIFLAPRSQVVINKSLSSALGASSGGPGRLDKMVARWNVVLQQPGRRAEGQALVYTAWDDKFVLTGGPPSIFDAERGKITGVSLTFFRTDDRVLVEGEASTPVVTQTRITR